MWAPVESFGMRDERQVPIRKKEFQMSKSQLPTINIKRWAMRVQYFAIVLILINVRPTRALAQDGHLATMTHQNEQLPPEQQRQQGALVKIVREHTERFQDVKVAENEGYHLQFGCVSGDDFGAMGLHYVNDALVGAGIVDITRPQIVLYEAQPNGSLKLTGADYLVLAEAWDANHPGVTPQLMGQIFHYFSSPNRFGLKAFYTLHVWAWKENPKGAFVNWHPHVSCQSFVGNTTP
jgi:hypothetical protein